MPEVVTQVDPDDSLGLGGRDLSALVCERIFDEPMPPAPVGCALFIDRVQRSPQGAWLHVHISEHGDQCEWIPRPFAEAIEAAMEVVEKMRERDLMPRLWAAQMWNVEFWRMDVDVCLGSCNCDSLPEAVCRAALEATENKK